MPAKLKFKKNKQYYLPEDDIKIKFIEIDSNGYYLFKYTKHPELDEYLTKDGTEVWENKKEFLKK